MISSQVDNHNKFGGVVPELATESHLENIEFIINKSLKVSKLKLSDIDGIAATAGRPCSCLTVGLNIGKAIAGFLKNLLLLLIILRGHALSPGLEKIRLSISSIANIRRSLTISYCK